MAGNTPPAGVPTANPPSASSSTANPPTGREERALRRLLGPALRLLPPGWRKAAGGAIDVVWEVVVGVYTDGFTSAGNLAYLTIVTLFPFFIVAIAVASGFGQSDDGRHAVEALLRAMPAGVENVLRGPVQDVLAQRTGNLLWLGAIVGLWTTGSFIQTIRDMLHRAYHQKMEYGFLRYRLSAIGLVIGSVVAMMVAFSLQFSAFGMEEAIARYWPTAMDYVHRFIVTTKIIPAIVIYGALWTVFYALSPRRYRFRPYPKWPGALATTCWWIGVTALLPWALGLTGGYDRTYGSLAGVMVTLIYFYFAGFGIVIGAELNAVLAFRRDSALKDVSSRDS